MANVRPNHNRIEVRIYAFGRTYSTTIDWKPTKANLSAARRQAEQCQTDLRRGASWTVIRATLRGDDKPPEAGTVGYYMQLVLDTAPITRPTLINYENTYHRIWAVFDHCPVDSVLKSQLQRRLAEFNYTPKGQRSAISVIRQAFKAAQEDGVIDKLPTDNWRVARQQKAQRRVYGESERDALIAQLRTQDETAWRFFTLAFYTGMRTEELLAIQKHHLKGREISVEQVRTANKLEDRTKTHSTRKVIVPARIWADVVEPYQFRDWLFTGAKGKPFTQQNRLMVQFQKAHDATGVERPLNRTGRPLPYPWRAAYVSIALQKGVPPEDVARQTGHDLRTMFNHYAELLPRADLADKIEEAFG